MPTNYTAADFTVENTTPTDTANLNRALAYLQQSHDAQEILKGMHEKGTKISIIHDGNDAYVGGSTNTIYWDPNSALTVKPNGTAKSTGTQSPALGLIHEGAHATDPHFLTNNSTYDPQYGKKSEKYAIEKESKIADTLGEPKRENHLAAGLPTVADSTTHSVNVYDKDGNLLKTEEHTYSPHKRKRDSEEPHADEAPAKDPKLAAAGEKFESLMNSLKEFKETGKTASMDATMKNIGDANVTGLIPNTAAAVTRKEQQTQLETARQAPQPAPAIGQPKGPSR